jgi:hypothetical protein
MEKFIEKLISTKEGAARVAVFFFFLWIVALLVFTKIVSCSSDPDIGKLGDSFGIINSLFGACTIIGVIYTLRLQGESFKDSQKQIVIQRNIDRIERFEGTFFQLISLHNEIIGFLRRKGLTGRACFKKYYNKDFQAILDEYTKAQIPQGHPVSTYNFNRTDMEGVAKDFFQRVDADLGHYFRNLYELVNLVDTQPDDPLLNKFKYINIIAAQLSTYELALLFYYGFYYSNSSFTLLIEKYSLLSKLNLDVLKQPHHVTFYSQAAFETKTDQIPQ